jgi:hypothetical protein
VASYCRSCGAAVVWVVTEPAGRRMPLDAEPAPDGTVVITDRMGGLAWVLTRAELDELAAAEENTPPEGLTPRYRSHFATCPEARQWRKSK